MALPTFMYHSELVRLTKKGPINLKVLGEPKESKREDKPPSCLVQLPDGSKRAFSLETQDIVEYFTGQVGRLLLTKAEGSDKDGTASLTWFPTNGGEQPPAAPPPTTLQPPKPGASKPQAAAPPAGHQQAAAPPPPEGSPPPARAPISQNRPPAPPPESQEEKTRRLKRHAMQVKNAIKLAIAAVRGAQEEAERELPGFLMSERERHGLISTVAINYLNNNVPSALPWSHLSIAPKQQPSDNDGELPASAEGEA